METGREGARHSADPAIRTAEAEQGPLRGFPAPMASEPKAVAADLREKVECRRLNAEP